MNFFNLLHPSWHAPLAPFLDSPKRSALESFLASEYATRTIYPPREKIFRAFSLAPFDSVKAVIVGQDPYINPGEAQGVAFHVPPSVKTPPSLANIAKELVAEFPALPQNYLPNLENWAAQGVLLLNDVLTVRAGESASHRRRGWEEFTSAAIRALATQRSGIAFLLWGKPAARKCACVDPSRHLVLQSPHPSPLSAYRGFFGNNHFSQTNQYLSSQNLPPINW